MKRLVAFFEIPASDFKRAVKFYETVLDMNLDAMDWEHEKMAFFPQESGKCPGAISYAADFNPSKDGTLVSLTVESMEDALAKIIQNGGAVVIPKTKIEAEGMGYFATFIDSEGNRMGLYSDN